MRGFYIVDFLLDLVYMHPGGVRTAMALFFSTKCLLRNTLTFGNLGRWGLKSDFGRLGFHFSDIQDSDICG